MVVVYVVYRRIFILAAFVPSSIVRTAKAHGLNFAGTIDQGDDRVSI